MNFSRWAVALCLVLVAWPGTVTANVAGTVGGGGGDEWGLKLMGAFRSAYTRIETEMPDLAAQIRESNLPDISNRATVLIVNSSLPVIKDGRLQFSICENDRHAGLILCSRARISTIRDFRLLEGIALHEIASLAGLESTGVYTYSSQYLARFDLKAEEVSPVSAQCSAPRSVGSICAVQLPDRALFESTAEVSNLFRRGRTGRFTTGSLSTSTQDINIYDDNKTYYISFDGRYSSADGLVKPVLTLIISSRQPASQPNTYLLEEQAKSFSVSFDRVLQSDAISTFLMTDRGDGNYEFKGVPESRPDNILSADFTSSNKELPGGIVLSTIQAANLNVDSGHDYFLVSQQKTTISRLVQDVDHKKSRVRNLESTLAGFQKNHESVLGLKRRLNDCLKAPGPDNCILLRRQYEEADLARDRLFLTMIQAQDVLTDTRRARARRKKVRSASSRSSLEYEYDSGEDCRYFRGDGQRGWPRQSNCRYYWGNRILLHR